MRNVLLIARREYKEQIRGRAFLLSTLLLPFLFVVLIGVGYLSTLSLGSQKHIVIVSDNHVLAEKIRDRLLAGKSSNLVVDIATSASAEEQAALKEQVRTKTIYGVLVLTNPVQTGNADGTLPTVVYTTNSAGDFIGNSRFEGAVNDGLVQERLARLGASAAESDALVKGVKIQTFQMRKDGTIVKSNAIASFYKGYVMAILLSMTTVIYGLNVARSIIQEKTSRIFEVMLSIAKPGDLLAGKLIGVGAVGLTQILIWVTAAAVILATPLAEAQMTGALSIHFTWTEAILFPVYFVLGYFLYSSLFAGLASTCETEQELQMFTPLAAVPIWLSFSLIILVTNDSNSKWSILASLFPPCTPIIMFLRMGSEIPPLWQILLSIVLMILSILALLWFSSKLYRVGILMYGKRATLPEIVRWLRLS